MHRTTTTHLSDALVRVQDLDEQLDDVRWMPIEQQVEVLVLGSVVMQGILDGTNTDEFTQEETMFIEQTVHRLNSLVEDMMLDANGDSDWNT
jgi:hypothetical protein|tara:strand:- start:1605 stop:1880 length:276 start_codon:yes stop_codon:yes gene_type:complete